MSSISTQSGSLNLSARALLFYGSKLPNHPRKWWLHEHLRRSFRARTDGAFNVIRQGLHWRLDPNDFACKELFWLGTKDSWELLHLKRILKPNDVVADVGANFGYYAISIANHLGGLCRVYAIEPHPYNFERLCNHVELNGYSKSVSTHRLAILDALGIAELVDQHGNSGHSQVVGSKGTNQTVATTLDRFSHDNKLQQLDFIILDVEGSELRAIEGARDVLMAFKPTVVVELWEPVLHNHGTSPGEVMQSLRDLGYELYTPDKSEMKRLHNIPSGDQRAIAFCVHSDRPCPIHWTNS